ncbi:MAG: TIGR03668 family PPOX class F420-dependent oxidoreductase [Acidimicrobiia bacterium]|nr:TIGR03668 family PPOX class F420-dependent oxidoreductase [Acidimicrobiia bacterium]
MPSLTKKRCTTLFASQPVAVLATVGPEGPHVVPIVFAVKQDRIVSAVDHKPKRTADLRRLANIKHCPQVSLLVQAYDDDWSKLWWVRADGDAVVVERGDDWETATAALQARYEQYRDRRPEGPAIVVSVTGWTGWEYRSRSS